VVYGALANLLVLLHLGFILFVMLGGLLVLRRPWIAWLHLPAAVWGALIELRGWVCPLTPWEQHLRRLAGQAGYSGGFIKHYVLPIIYPAGLTSSLQVRLGLAVVLVNLCIYAFAWRRSQHLRMG
jgi:hypothetical protein